MMKMKNIYKYLFAFSLIFFMSCEITDLDKQVDPTVPSPDNLDVDLTLNSIEISFANFFGQATEPTAEAVRLEYMFDRYEVNFNSSNANLQNVWSTAYATILEDVEALLVPAQENELYIHSGIARTIRAYVLLTMVDLFGDVPYAEANLGGENLFPGLSEGSEVYDAAIAELDLALADFELVESGTPEPTTELYYDSDVDSWIKLVNTLKFKAYLNLRLTDEAAASSTINSLVSGGDIIMESSENFVFQFNSSSEIGQHPYYVEEYVAATVSDYVSNYLMWTMAVEKPVDDPRLRYYTYRQVNEFPSDPAVLNNEIDCWNDPRPASYAPIDAISPVPLPFCALFDRGDGYWGRDHAENDGIPPDNTKRTTFGVYPVGGKFDNSQGTSITNTDGLQGAGIWPIMNASYVYFMRAEAALYLGTGEDPRAMLEEGVRTSIAYVTSFVDASEFENAPTEDDIEEYVTVVLNGYDAAGSDDERMAVIGKEYWIALFGNGIEAYNLYRRTGTPENLQPTLLGTGNFPRSFLYPNNSVNSNPSISQKSDLTTQVFWDNNPAGFIF
ncbi:SusD/RagB family nutrient-binding outer membrane lipoprotein [Gramella sp. BOM4]|nr:SusD/RagB family nutrient-binding outer membrane lipoprotein [Christiangramia bathymodioli]